MMYKIGIAELQRKNNTFPFCPLSLICLIVLLWPSCVPVSDQKEEEEVSTEASTPAAMKVYSWREMQRKDSVYQALTASSPSLRYWAATSTTTWDDISATQLYPLLQDPISRIRERTAYVLGQSHKTETADLLSAAFNRYDSTSNDLIYNSTILEAVGKTGTKKHALQLASVKTYTPKDSLLTLAQVRAFYQFALRGIIVPEVMDRVIDMATEQTYAKTVRYVASDYLCRFGNEQLGEHTYALRRAVDRANDPYVKANLIVAWSKVEPVQSIPIIEAVLMEGHPICRVFLLQHLLRSELKVSQVVVQSLLASEQPHIPELAARYFIRHGREDEAVQYRDWAGNESYSPRVSYLLQGAALRHLPFYYQLTKTTLTSSLQSAWSREKHPEHRMAILDALSQTSSNLDLLWTYYKEENISPKEQTHIIQLMGQTIIQPASKNSRSRISNRLRKRCAQFFYDQFATADIGVVCEMAQIIKQQPSIFQSYWDEKYETIRNRYNSLVLPMEWEAKLLLEDMMEQMGQPLPMKSFTKTFKAPDTATLASITDSTYLEVRTTKGRIAVELFPEAAPYTVSAICSLLQTEYYTSKTWHRVVPDFVVQTGCSIGHGYGGASFFLPTETSERLHFAEAGYVGMASAGPHTESTQWFINLRPSPHLDGRYTIFGKVKEGMNVLYQLTESDRIENIRIQ